jgi:putative cardiolipin synthase
VVQVHAGYARYREALLAGGVSLYELRPEVSTSKESAFGSSGAGLHTKAFLVDDELSFVGSFNLDPRSASLNTEMGLLIRDAGFAADLRAEFGQLTAPEHSYKVTLEHGELSWTGTGKDGAVRIDHEPETSWFRRVRVRLAALLPESQL